MENLISVIITTYNRIDTLKEAIISVCNQIYKNIEIIVVNDGGKNCKDIINNIEKNYKIKIKYLFLNKNRGPSAARNLGIKIAEGEYIAFLDDDDIYYPNHLKTLIEGLKHNHKFKIAYSGAILKEYKKNNKGKLIYVKDLAIYNKPFSREELLIQNYIPINAFLIKKEIFLKEEYWFDENMKYLEDYDLWLRLIKKYSFLHIPVITTEVRRLDDSLSENRKKILINQLKLYKKYPIDKIQYPIGYSKRKKLIDEFKGHLFLFNLKKINKPIKKISVIIPIIDLRYLKIIDKYLKKNTIYYEKEIILLLNDFEYNNLKIKNLKDFKIIKLYENYSIPELLNIGASYAKGEFLSFLINSVPNFQWLTSFYRFYKKYRNIGLIGGKTIILNNNIEYEQEEKNYKKIFNNLERYLPKNNEIEKLDYLFTYIFFIPKDIFFKVQGFNDKLDFQLSMLDFCKKIKRLNKKIFYNPFSEATLITF